VLAGVALALGVWRLALGFQRVGQSATAGRGINRPSTIESPSGDDPGNSKGAPPASKRAFDFLPECTAATEGATRAD
jgi:hypothetical protein